MSFPTVSLSAANQMFKAIGIKITRNKLGFYEAKGRGYTFQNQRLLDLTHDILKQIVQES